MSMRTMRPLCPSSPGRPVSPHSVREPAYLVRGWSAGCGWRPAEVAIALDLADRFIEAHGQRYAEGLLLLLRAQLMRAWGESVPAVRAAAERGHGHCPPSVWPTCSPAVPTDSWPS